MNFLNLYELGEILAEYLHFAGPLSVAITDFVRAQRAAILFFDLLCQTSTFRTQRDAGYQTNVHRPVVVKRAVIG